MQGEPAVQWIPCALREYVHAEVSVNAEDTEISIKKEIDKLISEYGNENIYKMILKGKRDPDIIFDTEYLAGRGNILEVLDRTEPDYDIDALLRENRDNLIGRYIGRFEGCVRGSEEYDALCEGLDALLTR